MSKDVPLAQIRFDEAVYPRQGGLSWQTVLNYRQAMESGEVFPPIALTTLKERPAGYAIVDGYHRYEATRALRRMSITAIMLKRMTEVEAFAESVRRNLPHGRQLSFYDKLHALKRLTDVGWSVGQVSELVHIPLEKLKKYQADRLVVSATGKVVPLKGPVKHLSEIDNPEDMAILSDDTQRHIFLQAIAILKNGWLVDGLQDTLGELRELLCG